MSAFADEDAAQMWNSQGPVERWTGYLRQRHGLVLRERLGQILEHRATILDTPPLWMSKPYNGALGLAYIGGGQPPVGLLLEAWERGELKLPCDCGGKIHVWFASGSPLSGRHSLSGGCPSCRKSSQPTLVGSGRSTGGFIGPVMQGYDRSLLVDEHKSALPFELIDKFVEGHDVVVRGHSLGSGDVVLEYDYRDDQLNFVGVEAANPSEFSCEWASSDLGGSQAGWETSRFEGIYGLQQHVLRARVNDVGTVLVGVAANRICVRGRGCVMALDGRLPQRVIERWARDSGVLAAAMEAAGGSS